ncbi:MAG: hypothetical protein JNJ57_19180, partial [Saprospiraceae bacterium]|nr:hypothetical protein [Saprospiraceae bacterium]
FEGEHKKGLKDGPGVLTFEDDEAEIRYEGLYKNDQMNGQGIVSYKDKKTEKVETFTGEFKDDAPYNGSLVEVNRKGEKRTATIVNGKQGRYKKEKPAGEK